MKITRQQAIDTGNKLKVDWSKVGIEQFRRGMEMEYNEHHKALDNSLKKAGMIVTEHLASHPYMYRS